MPPLTRVLAAFLLLAACTLARPFGPNIPSEAAIEMVIAVTFILLAARGRALGLFERIAVCLVALRMLCACASGPVDPLVLFSEQHCNGALAEAGPTGLSCCPDGRCTQPIRAASYPVWHDLERPRDKQWGEVWAQDGSRHCVSEADMNLDGDWLAAHGGHLP